MDIAGRLSDALNKREADRRSRTSSGRRSTGPSALAPAPGLKAVDPYDLIIVLAGEDTLPPLTDAERTAYKVHKVAYDVALEVPPFRVIGTVYLYPGSEPERLLDRATEMFVPVVDATAYAGRAPLGRGAWTRSSSTASTCAASSRSTGGPARRRQKLPGAPLGGTQPGRTGCPLDDRSRRARRPTAD